MQRRARGAGRAQRRHHLRDDLGLGQGPYIYMCVYVYVCLVYMGLWWPAGSNEDTDFDPNILSPLLFFRQFRIIATDRPTYNEDPEAMARGQMRPREKERNWERVKEDMKVRVDVGVLWLDGSGWGCGTSVGDG